MKDQNKRSRKNFKKASKGGDNSANVPAQFAHIEAIQAHVQYVLDKESEKATLVLATMPWAPAVEEPSPSPEV